MPYHVLIPAYGRDYRSTKEVRDSLLRGQDFILTRMGSETYANLESFEKEPGSTLQVRYSKRTKVTTFKVSALLKAREAAEKAPKADSSLASWLAKVDRVCNERTGLGYRDFPDIDYAGLHESGATPEEAVDALLESE